MATGFLSKVFGIQTLTLGAVVESLLIIKLLPRHVPEDNPLVKVLPILLAANVAWFGFFWGVINPYVLSPIRWFPPAQGVQGGYLSGMLRRPPGQNFLEYSEATPNDGLILLRSPFHKSRLLVTKPKALADLLVVHAYDFIKPRKIAAFLRHVLGDGLILVEGDVHKFQRKHSMPAFNFRHIKNLYPLMMNKAVAMTEAIEADIAAQPQSDEKSVTGTTEINAWASKVTLDIIGVAGMGKQLNVLRNSDDPLVHDYEELLEPTKEKMMFFFMSAFISRSLVKLLPWKLNEVFARTTTNLAAICASTVREKREAIKAGADDHFDILSLLIKSNDFSDAELRDQLLTFLAAGHETTSSALTWVCYLLGAHPEYQTRLRAEILEAFPAIPCSGPDTDLAGTLEKLPLLNAVCNETLRLYPTVPITMRIAIRNTRLLDHPVPRGTEILVCPWAVNRSREQWGENASEFVPERWIDGDKPNNNGGAESNYSLLTFLHGPRSCIGQNFAKAELRCLVAAFAASFEWELDMNEEDIIPAGVVTIKPANGLRLKLRALSNW